MTDERSDVTSETPEEGGPDDTLSPSEATDSDEVANADGDEVVDPPEDWQAADETEPEESLDRKLEAEEPDVSAQEPAPRDIDETPGEPRDVEIVHPDDRREDRPDDGRDDGEESLFPVVR